MKPVAVLGAGAFGTALAIAFAAVGRPVLLWARDAADVAQMTAARVNARRLPDLAFPPTLRPIADLREVPMDAVQVLALPAQATAAFLTAFAATLPHAPLVLAAKGVGLADGALQSQIATRIIPHARLAVLSGPGFAREIASGLPTALTLAADDAVLGAQLQERLSTSALRLYRSTDMTGVQLGGALKNVVALACGMVSGAALGESARAALMTRGFAEMVRLGRAMGGRADTFAGLSGLGDLALSCATPQSRNFAAGVALARGVAPDPAQTVEGVATARATLTLAARHGVEMPIAEAVGAVLDGRTGLGDAIAQLLSRPLKEERSA